MKKKFPWHALVFVAPALLIYAVLSAFPLIGTLYTGLFTQSDAGVYSFVGLQNYQTILMDPQWSHTFWNAMYNNLKFFGFHMLVQNPIALLLAALLSLPNVRFSATYRTVFFLPTLLSVVIVGFTWQLILSPRWGVAEGFMNMLGIGQYFAPWLGLEETVLPTLSLMSNWQYVGIPMMLIYASMISIPDDIIEAALVEGASPWRIFWQIRLPLILPTLGLTTILTFVGNFNAFDLIYAVKGAVAGPNYSSDILGTLFYRTFFGFQSQVANPTMGAAVATLMFLVILMGVGVYFVVIQRRLQRYSL
ncbi:carbohydrate ABC transporter permease [Rhodoferax aquaticus]|uniref:Sugar ABC transporter permease n=1 Tax=Rhodoferax aquaticus TaxID=2527691 RepID=A0A515EJK5_9BURK|nr:sugar ABC transporter permease [Rhodoferax aquaticus]QDL52857.1 sugar ABC transporter permease [Rhodoferax aquaticus]